MFCKWCGAQIAPAQTSCSHCGKEQPPLSECGGFYNLVPNMASRTSETYRAAAPVQPPKPQSPGAPAAYHNVGGKAPARRSKNIAVMLSIFGCTVLLAVLIFTVKAQLTKLEGKTADITERVNRLQSAVEATEKEPETLPPTEEPAPEEPSTEVAPSEEAEPSEAEEKLSEKDIDFTFSYEKSDSGETPIFYGTAGKETLTALYDLADFPLAANVQILTEETDDGFDITGMCSVEDAAVMETLLHFEEPGRADRYILRVTCDIQDDDLFGQASPEDTEIVISWRAQGDSGWNTLSELEDYAQAVKEADILSGREFQISAAAECFASPAEFRCTVLRKNADGGTMTINIGSIFVDPERDT